MIKDGKLYLSHSGMSKLICPLSYDYYIKTKFEPNYIMKRGSCVHNSSEVLLKPGKNNPVFSDISDGYPHWSAVEDIFKNAGVKEDPEFGSKLWSNDGYYRTAANNIMVRHKKRYNELTKKYPDVWEKYFWPVINEGHLYDDTLGVHGFIDQGYMLPNGRLIIEDIKSSVKLPDKLRGNKLDQLITYTILAISNGYSLNKIECVRNYYPVVGPFEYKPMVPMYRDINRMTDKIKDAHNIIELCESGVWMHNASSWNCRYCDAKDICKYNKWW